MFFESNRDIIFLNCSPLNSLESYKIISTIHISYSNFFSFRPSTKRANNSIFVLFFFLSLHLVFFSRFETNKSTKGASKLRRDLINAEIANLRDLLPLPQSTRQRLSQLQLMALVCVYVRKANYFQQGKQTLINTIAEMMNCAFAKELFIFFSEVFQDSRTLLCLSNNVNKGII